MGFLRSIISYRAPQSEKTLAECALGRKTFRPKLPVPVYYQSMMTVLPVLKVHSTSRVSLNDRFTDLMKSRASETNNYHGGRSYHINDDYNHQQSKSQSHFTNPSTSYNNRTTASTDTMKNRRQRAVERYENPKNQRVSQAFTIPY